ncbi:hypothetical protein AB4Y85_17040 [Microvirga sp. 2YAF29]|uniref:hypothetical protein n=1 Tax=Microvirga sp. 2YAF29 TaxID=3233031 RepID=UPI003F9E06D6
MLYLSDILKTGSVAGFKVGDSYPALVEALGPSELDTSFQPYLGCQYGDLEVYFTERGQDLVAHLVYLNRGGGKIRIDANSPFDGQGLKWGTTVSQVCDWLAKHDVPFSFDLDHDHRGEPQDPEYPEVLLPGVGYCIVSASSGLHEIYLFPGSRYSSTPS